MLFEFKVDSKEEIDMGLIELGALKFSKFSQ